MKKYFSISALFLFLFLASPAHADMLPEGQEMVPVCAKFTNLAEFKDYYFLSVSILEAAPTHPEVVMLEDNTCAKGYYKFATNKVMAVKKSDYPTKDFSSIKTFDDSHLIASGFSLPMDSEPVNSPTDLKSFEIHYKIASATDENIKIYKSSEEIFYKNNNDSHLMEYDATGKMTKETLPDRIFADIHGASDYADAILYLKDHSYINGYADGTFLEQNPINRAEFTKIVDNAIKTPEFSVGCTEKNIPASEKTVYFSDVLKGLWYSDYVCAAKYSGIINGYPDKTFKPANEINFAEAYKIILQAAYESNYTFNEYNSKNWYDTYFTYAYANGLSLSQKMNAGEKMTRGQMAQLMYLVVTHPAAVDNTNKE